MEREPADLLDALPALVWTAFGDGRADHVGRRWLEYAGVTAPEAADLGWQTSVHPDDLPTLRTAWAAIVASGAPGDLEARLRQFDGQHRRFLIRIRPMAGDAGAATRWCALAVDIEERTRAETTAREKTGHFQRIVDGLPAIVCLFGADGQIIFANKHFGEYADQTLEQLRHGTPGYSFHPDDRAEVLRHWSASVPSGKPIECEARVLRADGAERWHWVRGFPLRNAEGRIDLWYGLYTDIDDAKRAEAKLAAEKLLLEKVALGLPLPDLLGEVRRQLEALAPGCLCSVLLVDPAGDAFRIGAAPDGLEALTAMFDGGRIDARRDPMSLAVTQKVAVNVIDAGSDTRWAASEWAKQMADAGLTSCWTSLIHSGGGAALGLLAIHRRDATAPSASEQELLDRFTTIAGIAVERQAAEAALSRARDELAHIARITTFSSLTASIAHEINQPLSGIRTNAATCLRMLAADPPNLDGARATAQRTIRDGDRAAEVVVRLRNLFDRKAPARETVDLNDAAREVLVLLSNELQRGRVSLRTDYAPDLLTVRGDRVQLQQVVMNLVLNATDAMSAIEARPRDLLVATGWDSGNQVRLSVRDAGVGLDAQTLGKVFNPFYTTKTGGMGIGLSISRSIVESHDGRLWAAQNDGPGATFAFCLPSSSADVFASA